MSTIFLDISFITIFNRLVTPLWNDKGFMSADLFAFWGFLGAFFVSLGLFLETSVKVSVSGFRNCQGNEVSENGKKNERGNTW